jgi:hypothetical protein
MREALIVSFPETALPALGGLPDGRGFDVVTVRGDGAFLDRAAIALVRRAEGSLDIFSIMASDVLRFLEATRSSNSRELAEAFVGRVGDWQSFMARKRRPLSPQAQLGLMGELFFLDALIQSRLGAAAIDCWQGPLHSAQDFLIGSGAVEIKSSITGSRFLAKINGLEQLDADKNPLFLVALRFEVADDGSDLVEAVLGLRQRMAEAGMSRMLEALLLLSGYEDDHADHYRRKLRQTEARSFMVDDGFPCLRRGEVPPEVRRVTYQLDVDALSQPWQSLDETMKQLGLTDEP